MIIEEFYILKCQISKMLCSSHSSKTVFKEHIN